MNIDNIISKVLIEERGFTPPKNPPKNIQNILSQIQLFEMYPKIFAVVIKDDRLRARVFMRYQEFYESDSDTFRGKDSNGKTSLNSTRKKQKTRYSPTTRIGQVIIYPVIQLSLVSL